MRRLLLATVLVTSGAGLGCGGGKAADRPIAAGTLESVTMWKYSLQAVSGPSSNEGSSPPAGSRVEVYPNFILVTEPNGSASISPHGWYTNLRFKADPRG